ncbi:hypothetical protein OUZ56_010364 [Daphnia magna]|uniref:Uncharacterized protein n=1 Tax=Daphnia magna TaxID=35525 RepID=A0ABR0AIE4_9CRUS|nr:hypothetical protein OUZ56_010364 [Daphnia magna]
MIRNGFLEWCVSNTRCENFKNATQFQVTVPRDKEMAHSTRVRLRCSFRPAPESWLYLAVEEPSIAPHDAAASKFDSVGTVAADRHDDAHTSPKFGIRVLDSYLCADPKW